VPVINNLQTLDRETRALGLAKDLQEGVLFMCARAAAPPGGREIGERGAAARPARPWQASRPGKQRARGLAAAVPTTNPEAVSIRRAPIPPCPQPPTPSTYSTLVSAATGGRSRLDQ
jgi:hypothetical protein